MLTLGILGSGSGSNLQAILEAIESGYLRARVGVVLSDQADAYILERAENAGIPTAALDCAPYQTKFPTAAQDQAVEHLRQAKVDLVCLAGFMRLVGSPFLNAYPQRILNIHPSLLPAFPGLRAWEQALDEGAEVTGCTVHYVDDGMDTGPIILQAHVPVLSSDTGETLQKRIQTAEHEVYPAAIRLAAKRLSTRSTRR